MFLLKQYKGQTIFNFFFFFFLLAINLEQDLRTRNWQNVPVSWARFWHYGQEILYGCGWKDGTIKFVSPYCKRVRFPQHFRLLMVPSDDDDEVLTEVSLRFCRRKWRGDFLPFFGFPGLNVEKIKIHLICCYSLSIEYS